MSERIIIKVSESVNKSGQSVVYGEVLRVDDHMLRFAIKSDAYDFQCYARVERWSGSEWKNVHSIHHASMQTAGSLAYLPRPATASAFATDRDELLRVALAII